ncbi:MAG: CcdB family protein [Methylococcaceae bacterium]|nr:CcdB family protein [Methylococcaceae bacterium]
MPRFDVYRNSSAQAAVTPYLLDVQSDLLQGLETRIVIPLRRLDRFPDVKLPANLMPTFAIEGVECLLETPKLAAVPLRLLKISVTSLADRQFEITAALGFLFHGF